MDHIKIALKNDKNPPTVFSPKKTKNIFCIGFKGIVVFSVVILYFLGAKTFGAFLNFLWGKIVGRILYFLGGYLYSFGVDFNIISKKYYMKFKNGI